TPPTLSPGWTRARGDSNDSPARSASKSAREPVSTCTCTWSGFFGLAGAFDSFESTGGGGLRVGRPSAAIGDSEDSGAEALRTCGSCAPGKFLLFMSLAQFLTRP